MNVTATVTHAAVSVAVMFHGILKNDLALCMCVAVHDVRRCVCAFGPGPKFNHVV